MTEFIIWIKRKLGLPIYPWTGSDKAVSYIRLTYENKFKGLYDVKKIYDSWYVVNRNPMGYLGVLHLPCKYKMPKWDVVAARHDGLITPFENVDDIANPKCIWCKEEIPKLVAAKIKFRGF